MTRRNAEWYAMDLPAEPVADPEPEPVDFNVREPREVTLEELGAMIGATPDAEPVAYAAEPKENYQYQDWEPDEARIAAAEASLSSLIESKMDFQEAHAALYPEQYEGGNILRYINGRGNDHTLAYLAPDPVTLYRQLAQHAVIANDQHQLSYQEQNALMEQTADRLIEPLTYRLEMIQGFHSPTVYPDQPLPVAATMANEPAVALLGMQLETLRQETADYLKTGFSTNQESATLHIIAQTKQMSENINRFRLGYPLEPPTTDNPQEKAKYQEYLEQQNEYGQALAKDFRERYLPEGESLRQLMQERPEKLGLMLRRHLGEGANAEQQAVKLLFENLAAETYPTQDAEYQAAKDRLSELFTAQEKYDWGSDQENLEDAFNLFMAKETAELEDRRQLEKLRYPDGLPDEIVQMRERFLADLQPIVEESEYEQMRTLLSNSR